ncbi:hypothetical protein V8C37DRAFT_351749 [Trichoderma ceciliae]
MASPTRQHSSAMQNGSTIAAISPAYGSPWIVWQHPASAIALLVIICSVGILVAAVVSNACLPVHSYGFNTLRLYPTRQRRSQSQSSTVRRHQPRQNQLPCLAEA